MGIFVKYITRSTACEIVGARKPWRLREVSLVTSVGDNTNMQNSGGQTKACP
jgi:hypothetical protein